VHFSEYEVAQIGLGRTGPSLDCECAMSNHMIRWLEDAEAKRFTDTVRCERDRRSAERRHAHLGEAIAKIPSWLRRCVGR
jgi:hypothetical protein